MSFLKNLFKPKAGGTVIGNLFRTVAKTSTNGILGNGGGLKTQEDIDGMNMNPYDFFAKYGYNYVGTAEADKIKPLTVAQQTAQVLAQVNNAQNLNTNKSPNQIELDSANNTGVVGWVVGGVIALFVIVLGAKKMKIIK